jgi:PAS domain S-box-containing protein
MRHFPSTRFASGVEPSPQAGVADLQSVDLPSGSAASAATQQRPARSRALKLLVISGVVLIAATLVVTGALVIHFRNHALAESERELNNTALILAEQIDRTFESLELVQLSLSERIRSLGIRSSEDYAREMSGHDVHLMLKDKISGLPHVGAVVLIGADGRVINFSRYWPIPPINVADRSYFKSLTSDPAAVSMIAEPLQNRGDGSWAITLARKLTGPDGAFLGLILGAVEVSYFETYFASIALGQGSSIGLVRNDGTLLARYPRIDHTLGRRYTGGVEALAGGKSATARTVSKMNGKDRLLAYRRLSNFPLFISVGSDVDEILAPWQRQSMLLLGAGSVVAAVICLIVFLAAREVVKGIERSRRRIEEQGLKLDAALSHMSQGLCMFDAAGRLVLCNERYLQMYDLPADAVWPGCTLRDLVERRKAVGSFAGDPQGYFTEVLATIAEGKAARRLAEASGGRIIEIVNQPMTGGGWIATHNDITQQRRAEQDIEAARAKAECAEREARAAHAELQEREASFRLLFESNPLPMQVYDAETLRILAVNDAALAHYGYRREQYLAMTVLDIRPGEDRDRFVSALPDFGDYHAVESCRHLKSDGTVCEVDVYSRKMWYGGRPARIAATVDITERRHAERERDRNRGFLDLIIENVPSIIVVKAIPDFRYVLINRAGERDFGIPRGEMIGRTAHEVLPKATADRLTALDRKVLETRQTPLISEHVIEMPSGDHRMGISRRLLICDNDGSPQYLLAVVDDVTDRRRLEEERDRNWEFLHAVIESVPNTIFVRDARQQRYVLVNRAAESLWGISREQIIGRTPRDLFSQQTADKIAEYDDVVLHSDRPLLVEEHEVRMPNNGTRLIKANRICIRNDQGEPQYLLGVLEDVTDSRAVEQQLQQSQKMEAVGNLTGGLAHDFNNLLTVMIGNLDLLQSDVAGNRAAEQKLVTIQQAAERGADLTHQLLAFSRRQRLSPRRIDVNELIGNTARLLARTLGENIAVDMRLCHELWPVIADASQLEAALVNIAINARDAMPNGGVLTISSANARLDADYAARQPEAAAGDYVAIELRDSGTGMPPEVLAHIFEPFFTTKAPGRGTGLGLSMVYGFIKQSGGHLSADSRVGEGTVFKLYLPRAAEAEATPAPLEVPRSVPVVNGKVILAVDDNPAVRATVLMQLRSLGYSVLEADSPQAALSMLDSMEKIDLLFTDMVMPGPMNGRQLAAQARVKRPDLKVLYTSGFPGMLDDADDRDALLNKPYRKRDLASAIHRALHGGE